MTSITNSPYSSLETGTFHPFQIQSDTFSLPPGHFIPKQTKIQGEPSSSKRRVQKNCGRCQITKWSRFYRHPIYLDLCQLCYDQTRRTEKICYDCGRTESCQWYRNPIDPSKDRCRQCYEIARGVGTLCNTCGNTKSCRWLRDPVDRTKDLCYRCYGLSKI